MKKKIILKQITEVIGDEYTKISIADVQKIFEGNLKERGLRVATICFYNSILEVFYKYIDYRAPIASINNGIIVEYIKYCKEVRNHSDNTISTSVRGLRTFLYFAMKNSYLPKFQISVPTPDMTPKTTYELEDIKKLLIIPNINKCNFSEYVAFVAISMFVFTGMRLSTAINIKVEDIDFDNNVLKYKHTKNKNNNIVPLPRKLKNTS
jgi:integrase/recombinase XerD